MQITGTCDILFVRVIGVVKVSLSIVLYTYCHQLFYNSFVTYTHGFPFWSKGCLNPPHSPLAPWYICTLKKSVQTSLLFNFIFFSFINFFLSFFENSNTFVDEGKNTGDGKNFQFKHGYDTECTNLVDVVNYFTLFGTTLKHFVCLTEKKCLFTKLQER